MHKKVLLIALTVCLIAALALVPAFAAEGDVDVSGATFTFNDFSFPSSDVSYTLPVGTICYAKKYSTGEPVSVVSTSSASNFYVKVNKTGSYSDYINVFSISSDPYNYFTIRPNGTGSFYDGSYSNSIIEAYLVFPENSFLSSFVFSALQEYGSFEIPPDPTGSFFENFVGFVQSGAVEGVKSVADALTESANPIMLFVFAVPVLGLIVSVLLKVSGKKKRR